MRMVASAPPCTPLERGEPRRCTTCIGRLFEGIGQSQELGFAPGPTGEGQSQRKVWRVPAIDPTNEATWHLDAGIASLGGNRRSRHPRKDHGIELVLVHVGIDPALP